ncbi:MAG: restriction endonuclease subunit S [Candidatus Marinimicrobia bacterium]|nr:restriction endonuclease subunit S [Candidatus Neomarinimicrobiota bacterium]
MNINNIKIVPKGWQIKQVDQICDLGRGRVINKTELMQNSGVFPVYSSQTSNNGQFGAIRTYDFDGEYVTWTTDGEYAGTTFYRTGKFNCTNVCGTLKAKNEKEIDMQFLTYVLLSITKNYVVRTANPKLMNGVMAKIPVVVPQINEQKKIAEILSTVDLEIEKTEEIISQTEKLKEGILRELFTKGIGHKNFKKTNLGNIPANWDIKKLEEVVFFENGKAHENFIDDSGEFIVVNSKFIAQNGGVVKRTNNGLKILNKGDVAIVMSDIPQGKALAKCFFVDEDNKYTLNQRIGLLRPLNGYNKYFFYFLNRNKYFLNFSNETSQTNLRRQQVLDCPVAIPPLKEQEKIAEIISSIDEKISINMQHKETLLKLKKGLSQDLLTGKVRTI